MAAQVPGKARRPRDDGASRDADEFAWMSKPLPPEPVPWVRLPATWRHWSFSALAWFAAAGFLMWMSQRGAGAPTPDSFWWSCLLVAALWIGATLPGSVVDRMLAARLEAQRRRHPEEPWLWDHRWDPRGVSGSPFRRLRLANQKPISFLFVAIVQLAFGMSRRPFLDFWGIVGGTAASWIAVKAWRIYGVGTAYVAFTKFPFHPGERVTLHFGMSEGGARFERAAFCLRFIEEASGALIGRRLDGVRYFGVREDRPPGELPSGDQHVILEFDVPEDAGGTSLSSSPRTYWTLDVVANTSAGPYVESFLIPIYERPAAPAAA